MVTKKYLIVGTMRSGSSALTGLLELFGLKLHDDLLEPNSLTSSGCKESKRVVRLNDEILAKVGSCWNSTLPMPVDWLEHDDFSDWVSRAAYLLEEADVIKDPRMGRVLPVWIHACRMNSYRPVVLITNRGLQQVIASTMRLSPPFSPNSALAFWGSVHVDLIVSLAGFGVETHYIPYVRMMNDWEWVPQLLKLPEYEPDRASAIEIYLNRSISGGWSLPKKVFNRFLFGIARMMERTLEVGDWEAQAHTLAQLWDWALHESGAIGWSTQWSVGRVVPFEADPEEMEEQRWRDSIIDPAQVRSALEDMLQEMKPFV